MTEVIAPAPVLVGGPGMYEDTYEETLRMDVHELVRRLVDELGPTLVATLADVRDRKLPHKWAAADGPMPRTESHRRLLAAHRIWTMISGAESADVARAWFIGTNPRLSEEAPVLRLRAGDVPAVLAAARAFVGGSDG